MPTFKSLFEKVMLRLGSRGARQSDNVITVEYDSLPDIGYGGRGYVAPADGFFEATGTTNNAGYIWLGENNIRQSTSFSAAGIGIVDYIPCRKGRTVFVSKVNVDSFVCRFISSVGGNS